MRVKFNVISAVGGADIPSLKIYTAFDRRFGNTEPAPSAADMQTYSTYSCAQAVNNSVAKLKRSCYASDLLENAQWHDSDLTEAAGVYTDTAYVAAGRNPNFFTPALFITCQVPTQTQQVTINYTAEITYYFSYRNPKYGGTAGSSKLETETLDTRFTNKPDADDDVDMEAIEADLEEEDRVPVTAVNIARKAGGAEAASQARRAARAKNALSRRSEGLPG